MCARDLLSTRGPGEWLRPLQSREYGKIYPPAILLGPSARRQLLRAPRPNKKWSMDFVTARLLDGRWFGVFTVVDHFTRECLLLLADSSLTGQNVASASYRSAEVASRIDGRTWSFSWISDTSLSLQLPTFGDKFCHDRCARLSPHAKLRTRRDTAALAPAILTDVTSGDRASVPARSRAEEYRSVG